MSVFGRRDPVDLASVLSEELTRHADRDATFDRSDGEPGTPSPRYRCRVVYDEEIREISFSPYYPSHVSTLKVVVGDGVRYDLKYEDRSALTRLRDRCADYDDIVITIAGLVTDGSYANLAFYDGGKWFTPDRPLLAGTRRRQLLAEGRIAAATIHVEDIWDFEKVSLINAMLDLGEVEVPTSEVYR